MTKGLPTLFWETGQGLALVGVTSPYHSLTPLGQFSMSVIACYQQSRIESKNEDQVLVNSNTVISGRAPIRMGSPVMPMPRFM